jgi:hypothetical protein
MDTACCRPPVSSGAYCSSTSPGRVSKGAVYTCVEATVVSSACWQSLAAKLEVSTDRCYVNCQRPFQVHTQQECTGRCNSNIANTVVRTNASLDASSEIQANVAFQILPQLRNFGTCKTLSTRVPVHPCRVELHRPLALGRRTVLLSHVLSSGGVLHQQLSVPADLVAPVRERNTHQQEGITEG